MTQLVSRRPSPAMVVACIALIVAVGGTASALPGRARVKQDDIARNAVRSKHIKTGQVRSSDIRNGAVKGRDVDELSLATVPDASRLGGVGAGDFLRRGAAASGDLAGTYPNPSIGAGAVTPAKFGTIPAARAFHSVAQSIPNNTLTSVALDSEAFDTADLHSTAANNSRLMAPESGLYSLTAAANWFVNPTGFRVAQIWRNGSTILVSDNVVPNADDDHVLSTLARLSAGDYVELKVNQNSGAPLLLSTGPQGQSPLLTMHWVAPG
jgi:hypothetical protein